MVKVLRLLILMMLTGHLVMGQDTVTSGTVKSATGDPLPGVTVLLKGTSIGTSTDADGKFKINEREGTLVFSFIGYTTTEVAINNQTVLDVVLQDDARTLEEIVVVGYGTQQRKDVTGAIAVVGAKELENRPNTQFGNLLEGKTAGVQVLSPSGKPSSGFEVRIRGTASILGNSNALFVVDGIPSSDTRNLNPADIETLTVLKDASAAAIYGAQGANGVVLITTKKGKTGAPKVDFNAYTGFSSVWKTQKVLNSEQYRDLMTELGQNTDWSLYTQNTDWQKKVFQQGHQQNYQAAVSGKTDQTTYYISGGWMKNEGAVRSAEMDRYTFKINLEQKLTNWATVGTNLNYMRYHDVDVADNAAVNQGGVLLGVLSTPPNIGVFRPNGTYSSNPFQDWENPIAGTDGSKRDYRNQRVLGNVYAELMILPDLKFRSNVGIDYQNGIYDYFLDPFMTSYGRAKKGIASNTTNLSNYYIIDNTLTYTRSIGAHVFSGMVGVVAQKTRWENANIEKNGFSGNSVPTTNAGSTIVSANNDKDSKTNAAFISRINYSYADKYLLTANFRTDGSSTFGPNKRYGYYPSVSAGWRISQEPFFKGIDQINDLKLRAGWGIVGNDLPKTGQYLGLVGSGANYPIGGVILPGTYQSSIANYSLQWESTVQANVGIDISILDSRVGLTVDAYVKNSSNLLLPVPLPHSTGFDNATVNAGKIQNKGIEVQVNTKNLTGPLTWSTDFNITFNRNKVVNILGQQMFSGTVASRGDASYNAVGFPLAQIYGYVAGGVDPATGMEYYVDRNGESTFSPTPEDRKVIGNTNPKFYYGMTNTLAWKGISLSIFIQGTQGNDVLNATKIEMESMSDPKNQSVSVTRRWRNPGDVTDIPKAVWANTDNTRISTRFVENGSYLRAKAVTLAYQVPGDFLSKYKLKNLKVYATGENLFTITKYSGFDPEVNSYGGSNIAQGLDFGTYPQTRNIIFGLNVTF